MKIVVKRVAPDVYSMSFDDVEVALDSAEVKTLLLQITQVLAPPGKSAQGGEGEMKTFMRHLRSANDPGIQALLRQITHDDALVLLKLGESDEALLQKLYGNMSENARKLFEEDLSYKFKEGVPEGQAAPAMKRVKVVAEKLRAERLLEYSTLKERQTARQAHRPLPEG
ncbi:MAG: hypothetical protein OQJ87_10455 [Rhodospirillales bacterium]|nr:hypothetical protein [Rhodospirillales bacterium]MCW9039752.1 hypothetical protein [Rhodospirillales bacterium]